MLRFLRPPTAVGSSPLRIQVTYWWRHRRLARLKEPVLFTEWVQHRKLHDRNPQLPKLADKVAAKDFVAARLGKKLVTPTLWRGSKLPAEPAWDFPFVVKARHGCGQTVIVRNEASYKEAVRQSRKWMQRGYGAWLDEWLYQGIPRGLLVEPFIGEGSELPIDYKVFVFGGRAAFVQVHLERAGDHRWIVFDREWKRVSQDTKDPDPPVPVALTAMLQAAEQLAEDFSFVRADFYEVAEQPRFGELTFYPGSGLEPVEPPKLDLLMGLLWSAAIPCWLESAARLVA